MATLYNSLTFRQDSVPIKHLNMYICGPTLYDEAHMGHARTYVTFDIIKRILRHLGYGVTSVMNLTDIDDKIIQRKSDVLYYAKSFEEDMKALNVLDHDHVLRVTDCIGPIVQYIQTLLQNGFAYTSQGSVYFDLEAYKTQFPYPVFVKPSRDEMIPEEHEKKHKEDFALWKSKNDVFWKTELGNGRPGWHTECATIIYQALGHHVDIHVGGIDLKYPHHENELAQIRAHSNGHIPMFLHIGHVTVDGVKMSKSLGNAKTIKEELAKYTPNQIRFCFLAISWKSPTNYTEQLMETAVAYDKTFQSFQQNIKRKLKQSSVAAFHRKDESALRLKFLEVSHKVQSHLTHNMDTPKVLKLLKTLMACSTTPTLQSRPLLDSVYQYILHLFDMLGIEVRREEPEFREEFERFRTRVVNVDPTLTPTAESYQKGNMDINHLVMFREEVRKRALKTYNTALLRECESLRTLLQSERKIMVSDTGETSYIKYL